jgi:uncharacterized protein
MAANIPADQIREFVIAAHGDLGKVQEMLAATPELLNVSHAWSDTDHESPIQAAAHVGNKEIAEFLLDKGAPLAIATAAMLGRRDHIEEILAGDPTMIKETGAHGIPILAHAAWNGDTHLFGWLVDRDATEGMSFALGNAVTFGHKDLAEWILANGKPDLTWTDFTGKTPLQIAEDKGYTEIAEMLRNYKA